MPTPSTRTPVRIARGSYSNLNGSVSDLQDGEISYAEDQNKLYVKEGSSLVALTYTPASPAFTGTITGVNLTLSGDLTVNGTTTTINTQTLDVEDKNIVIGKVSTPSDTTADGGGITLKGASDKTFNWVDSTDAWTSSEHLHLLDNKKLFVGTGSDLSIYHDGSNSYIHESGTGNLVIRTSNLYAWGHSGEDFFNAVADGAVSLYYDNVKTFLTDANGITVQGPEGGNALINLYADEGDDNADKRRLLVDTNGDFYISNYADGAWETDIMVYQSEVRLYYDNSIKLQTASTGVTVTGTVSDSKGNLRSIPMNTQSSAYTLVASDAGKVISISSGGVTVNNSVHSSGDAITIINNSGSDQTITQGSGLSMYNSSDASTGNRVLAARGMATLWFRSSGAAYISGAGLS